MRQHSRKTRNRLNPKHLNHTSHNHKKRRSKQKIENNLDNRTINHSFSSHTHSRPLHPLPPRNSPIQPPIRSTRHHGNGPSNLRRNRRPNQHNLATNEHHIQRLQLQHNLQQPMVLGTKLRKQPRRPTRLLPPTNQQNKQLQNRIPTNGTKQHQPHPSRRLVRQKHKQPAHRNATRRRTRLGNPRRMVPKLRPSSLLASMVAHTHRNNLIPRTNRHNSLDSNQTRMDKTQILNQTTQTTLCTPKPKKTFSIHSTSKPPTHAPLNIRHPPNPIRSENTK